MRQNIYFIMCLSAFLVIPAALLPGKSITDTLDSDYPGLKKQAAALKRPVKENTWQKLNRFLKTDGKSGGETDIKGELKKGMELVVNSDFYLKRADGDYENLALEMLLSLIEAGCYRDGDSITFALVMANNFLYERCDNQAREKIRQDMAEHYKLYKRITAWQNSQGLGYSLDKAGLIPKIFWAARYRSFEMYRALRDKKDQGLDRISPAIYGEYFDRISTLDSIFQYIKEEKLVKKSFSKTAWNLENRIYQFHKYRHSIKIEDVLDFGYPDADEAIEEIKNGQCFIDYKGTTYNWEKLVWLNYQWKERFLKGERTIGDCGTMTCLQMGFYRAAGIAPLTFQRIYQENAADYENHNFPGAYNRMSRRWQFIQTFDITKPGYNPTIDVEIYIERPYRHYRDFENNFYKYQLIQEKTVQRYFSHLILLGFTKEHMEKLYFHEGDHKGALLTPESAPREIYDRDNDGLYDSVEKDYSLSTKSADSDKDGYSDFWELDNGYDPAKKRSAPPEGTFAVDGLLTEYKGRDTLVVKDAKNDGTSGTYLDIKKLYAVQDEQFLYLGAEYYQIPEAYKGDLWHTIHIKAFGTDSREFWIQGTTSYKITQILELKEDKNHTKIEERANCELVLYNNGEFKLPLSLFEGFKSLQIKYIGGGYDEKGERAVLSDHSRWISMDIGGFTGYKGFALDGDLSDLALFETKKAVSDPANDGEAADYYDIKEVAAAFDDKNLYVGTSYFSSPEENGRLTHTLHIQAFGQEKMNFWIQGGKDWGVGRPRSYRDGRDSALLSDEEVEELKKKVGLGPNEKLFLINPASSGTEWKIPLALFAGSKVIKIRCIGGGYKTAEGAKKGEKEDRVILADSSDWFTLDISKVTGYKGAAVDGTIEELINSPGTVKVSDPQSDYSTHSAPDIKTFYGAVGKDVLKLGADFHSLPEGAHDYFFTLNIVGFGTKRVNYRFQGNSAWGFTYMVSYIDGEKGKALEDYTKDMFTGTLDKAWEWQLPLSLFKEFKVIKVQYMTHGKDKKGEQKYNSDHTGWLTLDISGYTGVKGDLTDGLEDSRFSSAAAITDEKGDGELKNDLDIKTFSVYLKKGKLYARALYYKEPDVPENLWFTLHIKTEGSTKNEYWLQGNFASGFTNLLIKNKTTGKWDKITFDRGLLIYALADCAEWELPLSLLGNPESINSLEIKHISGGFDKEGKSVWRSDETGFLKVLKE